MMKNAENKGINYSYPFDRMIEKSNMWRIIINGCMINENN